MARRRPGLVPEWRASADMSNDTHPSGHLWVKRGDLDGDAGVQLFTQVFDLPA